MCTAVTHALVGAAILRLSTARPLPKRTWLLAPFLAAAPDLDAIGYWLDVPYDSLLGHRGLTHSLPFALLAAALCLPLFSDQAPTPPSRPLPVSRLHLWLTLAAATASHGLLDMLTDGGLGIALFSPFSNHRFFFPAHPVHVSLISISAFFTTSGLRILANEALWVLLPTAILLAAVELIRVLVRSNLPGARRAPRQ